MSSSSSLPRPRSSSALVFLAAAAAGVLLYFAHAVFVLIVLAVLFSLLLSSPVEGLDRRDLPRAVSAIVILVIILAVAASGVYGLRNPAQKWLAAAPHTASVIQHKITPVARVVQRIEVVSARAGKLAETTPTGAATPSMSAASAGSDTQDVLVATRAGLVEAMTVVILTLFLVRRRPLARSLPLIRPKWSSVPSTFTPDLAQLCAVRRAPDRLRTNAKTPGSIALPYCLN